MATLHATDDSPAPYNTAYLRDDRSHLYATYEIDPHQDREVRCPETGVLTVPTDYAQRRDAILSFYGHRCGRCLTSIDVSSTGRACELGYLYQLESESWALDDLVAVCEPCYDVLATTTPDHLGTFGDAYRRSQQFPQWLGDPRVAVERLPLTGRELWIREQLESDCEPKRPARELEASVNARVVESSCLAVPTPAAAAIEFGERLTATEWHPIPDEQRLTARWETLSEDERETYVRRAANQRSLLESSFVPALGIAVER